ncbi:MAG: hypothetical protein IJX25_00195 [Clostridia bacterium]|nr:hypothetical protein [Clostridia bacterium]
MKVYVDEMPKDCLDCPCISECYYCNLLHDTVDFDGVPRNCPLQSLVEHDQQVEKNLIDKMANLAGDYWSQPYVDEDIIMTGDDFAALLKQLKKGDADNGKTIQG